MYRALHCLSALGLIFAASACQALPAPQNPDQIIVSSPNDPREYRFLRLDNGIKVTLVSNPDTETAAAAVGVNIGAYQNPDEWPGLAHLLEHMLFLGSDKYPSPNDFDDFISSHGGYNNAWTSSTDTVFYFAIPKNHLFPAIDRLSQFFISPQMNPDLLDRERHAVDSEFQIYRQQDRHRIHHVEKATVNPDHPYARFATGNLQTLTDHDDLNLRDALLELHKTWYTADNISVAIVSDTPLDDLEASVHTWFSNIAPKKSPERVLLPPVYTQNEKGIRLDIQTKKNLRNLSLKFPIPIDNEYLKYKPMDYIGHILGYEGQGSLYNLFKDQGWIYGLSAWGGDNTHDAYFEVEVDLTEEGYDHIDDITEQIFAYLKLLQEQGVTQSHFVELRAQQDLRFRFMEKGEPADTAITLVEHMPILPPKDLIQAHFLTPEFSPIKIQKTLDHLTPENMRMRVVTDMPPPVPESDIIREQWTDIPYSIRPFTTQQINQFQSAELAPDLFLPPANPYMPKDISLIDDIETKNPEQLVSQPGFQSWFRHDNSFKVPENNLFIRFTKPDIAATPVNTLLFHLYGLLLSNSLNEILYQAGLAGLDYNLSLDHEGFVVDLSGFNENLPDFFDTLLKGMQNLQIEPAAFQHEKTLIEEQLRSMVHRDPGQLIKHAFFTMMYEREFTAKEKLDVLARVTPERLQEWSKTLYSQSSITMLINGNLSKTMAKDFTKKVGTLISKSQPKPFDSLPRLIPASLRQPVCYVSYDNDDAVISVVTQSMTRDMQTRASFHLLSSLLSTPFYNRLRTEEQLGYLVLASVRELERFPVMKFHIQSPEHTPEYLNQRITIFLNSFAETINGLTEEQMQSHKDGLISSIQEPDASLSEQSNSFWNELDEGFTNFDQDEKLIKAIQQVKPEDIKKLYANILKREHQIRLYGYSKNKLPESLPPACNDPAFISQFRDQLPESL